MAQQVNIQDMINQSKDVLTHPSEATFERYEKQGGLTQATIYVAIAAAISGLVGLIVGLATPTSVIGGLIGGILYTLVNFYIFTGLVYYVGKAMGGTGSFDEVAYTFALFIAPLNVIGSLVSLLAVIPILGWIVIVVVGLALLIAQIYFAYIAVRSSMNLLDQGKAIVTMAAAFFGTIIIRALISSILGF